MNNARPKIPEKLYSFLINCRYSVTSSAIAFAVAFDVVDYSVHLKKKKKKNSEKRSSHESR